MAGGDKLSAVVNSPQAKRRQVGSTSRHRAPSRLGTRAWAPIPSAATVPRCPVGGYRLPYNVTSRPSMSSGLVATSQVDFCVSGPSNFARLDHFSLPTKCLEPICATRPPVFLVPAMAPASPSLAQKPAVGVLHNSRPTLGPA